MGVGISVDIVMWDFLPIDFVLLTAHAQGFIWRIWGLDEYMCDEVYMNVFSLGGSSNWLRYHHRCLDQ